MTKDHCPACQVVRELTAHRDSHSFPDGVRRWTLNFAVVIARSCCPDYKPTSTGDESA